MAAIGILLLAAAAGLAAWFGPGMPLGAVIYRIDPAFLGSVQAGTQRHLAPWLWDRVMLPLLEWPSWVVPAALGVLLVLLGARRAAHA